MRDIIAAVARPFAIFVFIAMPTFFPLEAHGGAAGPAPEQAPPAAPAPASTATQVPESTAPWEVVHEVEGITVYSRASQNPSLKEYKAVGILDLPASVLTGVMKDRARYTEFFPYLEENRPILKDGHRYSYERISAPLVSERDYTVEQLDEDLEGGGFRMRFHEANDQGPAASTGKVRVQVVRGMWEILSKGADRAQVTYHVYTDPGGAIPNFIINAANKKGVSRAVLALRDRARSLLRTASGQ